MRFGLTMIGAAVILVSAPAIGQDVRSVANSRLESMGNRVAGQNMDQHFRDKLGQGFAGRGYKITSNEDKILTKLETQIERDPAAAASLAATAKQSVSSPDGKYVLAALQLKLGGRLTDEQMQSEATDLALASGAAPAESLPQLLRNQAIFALDSQNFAKAERAFEQLAKLLPADSETLVSLAQVKSDSGKYKEALPLFEQAIKLKTSANQPVPETWAKAAAWTRSKALQQ